jgi:hypothetical protein
VIRFALENHFRGGGFLRVSTSRCAGSGYCDRMKGLREPVVRVLRIVSMKPNGNDLLSINTPATSCGRSVVAEHEGQAEPERMTPFRTNSFTRDGA